MSNPDLLQEIKNADLRYVSDSTKGITRKKEGESFVYVDADGKKITSVSVLDRIRQLVIPPAWECV